MENKFYCNCDFHYIDADIRPIDDIAYVGMTIYEHKSGVTGKSFKKPKELGSVVLIGKEALKFKSMISKVRGLTLDEKCLSSRKSRKR